MIISDRFLSFIILQLLLINAIFGVSSARLMLEEVWSIETEYEVVSSVSVSSNGFVSVGLSQRSSGEGCCAIELYDINGKKVWSQKTSMFMPKVSITSSGDVILVGSLDQGIVLYDSMGNEIASFDWQEVGSVEENIFIASDQYISDNGLIITTKSVLIDSHGKVLWNKNEEVLADISANGKYILLGSTKLQLLDEKGKILWSVDFDAAGISLSPSAKYAAAFNEKGEIILVEKSGNVLWKRGINGSVEEIDVSDDGKVFAVIDQEYPYFGGISAYDANGNVLWKVSLPMSLQMEVSRNGRFVVAGSLASYSPKLYLIDTSSGQILQEVNLKGGVKTVSVSANGKYVAAGTLGGRVYLFEVLSGITEEKREVPLLETKGGLKLVWSWNFSEDIRDYIIIDDLDYDGFRDIVVTGHPKGTYAMSSSGKIYWTLEGEFFDDLRRFFDDVDGDGKTDILALKRVPIRGEYEEIVGYSADIYMISSVTGKILWKKRVDPPVEPTDKFRSYVYIFSIYDVTGDGVRDVLVDFEYRDYPSGEADGYYLIIDGVSSKEVSRFTVEALNTEIRGEYFFPPIYVKSNYDLNGDGKRDLLLFYRHSIQGKSISEDLIAVDLINGKVIWRLDYKDISGFITLKDYNGDGAKEMLLAINDGVSSLVLLDPKTGKVTKIGEFGVYTYPTPLQDVDGDGSVDCLLFQGNSLVLYSISKKDAFWKIKIGYKPSRFIVIEDINGDGVYDIITANISRNNTKLDSFSGINGEQIWSRDVYLSVQSNDVSIWTNDLSGDKCDDVVLFAWDRKYSKVEVIAIDPADGKVVGRAIVSPKIPSISYLRMYYYEEGVHDLDKNSPGYEIVVRIGNSVFVLSAQGFTERVCQIKEVVIQTSTSEKTKVTNPGFEIIAIIPGLLVAWHLLRKKR